MTNISSIRRAACRAVSLEDIVPDGEHASPADASAVLIARNGRDAQISRDGCVSEARVAFGCVVQPEPGDRVLIGMADGTIWVTSVLERSSDAPMRLWAEGDVSIISMRGDVSLMAARCVNLDAGERTRLAAAEIDLHAGVARFVLDELVQVGRRASLMVGKIRYVGEMIETFAEHMLSRSRRSSMFVEESHQLRAGDIDHRAESTLQMRAQTMLMTADAVVRVDADQIHMG
ncbi:MAG: DUF3540 domain-containing protein [Acetobacteraceae bacterium]|jgi:hypothetical protein